jgi:hypothetical protein
MPSLTEKFIASLGPREGKRQYDIYGPRSSGLGLCYSNGGARTWRGGQEPPHEHRAT